MALRQGVFVQAQRLAIDLLENRQVQVAVFYALLEVLDLWVGVVENTFASMLDFSLLYPLLHLKLRLEGISELLESLFLIKRTEFKDSLLL